MFVCDLAKARAIRKLEGRGDFKTLIANVHQFGFTGVSSRVLSFGCCGIGLLTAPPAYVMYFVFAYCNSYYGRRVNKISEIYSRPRFVF